MNLGLVQEVKTVLEISSRKRSNYVLMRNAGMGSYLSCQYSLSEYHKTDLKGTAVCSAIQRVGIYLLNF